MPMKRTPPTLVEVPKATNVVPLNRPAVQSAFDADDLLIPNLKILQGLSPEVQENARKYISGELYHSMLDEMLGKSVTIAYLAHVKTLELWAPRDTDQGLLARSIDGVTWDKPHTAFSVKVKSGAQVTWNTRGSVAESGLAEFGSSDPANPKSAPAASLTFRIAMHLFDYPEASPVMYIGSRTQIRPVREFMTRLAMSRTPTYGLKFDMQVKGQSTGPNSYWVPSFKPTGKVTDPDLLDMLKDMAESMRETLIKQASVVIDPAAANPGMEGGSDGPLAY
jgi:hypothetical protein